MGANNWTGEANGTCNMLWYPGLCYCSFLLDSYVFVITSGSQSKVSTLFSKLYFISLHKNILTFLETNLALPCTTFSFEGLGPGPWAFIIITRIIIKIIKTCQLII